MSKVLKKVLIGCVWVGLVMMAVSVAYVLAFNNKIAQGVMLGNVAVGGITGEQAAVAVETAVAGYNPNIKVINEDDSWIITAGRDTWQIDVLGSINEAWMVGRRGNIFTRVGEIQQGYIKGVVVPLKVSASKTVVEQQIASISALVNESEIEPALVVMEDKTGKRVEKLEGRDGLVVDEEQLTSQLWQRWEGLSNDDLVLPTKVVRRKIDVAEMERVAETANKLLDKRLVLKEGDDSWIVDDKEMIGWLSLTGSGGWDRERLDESINEWSGAVDRLPQNAAFRFENGKVTEFKPGTEGKEIQRQRLEEELDLALPKLMVQDQVEVKVPVTSIPPLTSTAEVNDMGIRELLGRGVSYYHHSIANRVHNVGLASERVSGVVVPPGEVFSFNTVLGEVSGATGYKAAYVISGGRTVLGDGGGVCQVSTTLFRALLDAGLPILERKAHAYRVSYYEEKSEPGIDATVFSPSVDLKFKNDTPAYVLIQVTNDPQNYKLVFEIYGTSDGRQATISPVRIWGQSAPPPAVYQDDPTLPEGVLKQVDWAAGGAKTSFDYKVVRGDEVLQEKTYYSSYQPWRAVFLKGTKKP